MVWFGRFDLARKNFDTKSFVKKKIIGSQKLRPTKNWVKKFGRNLVLRNVSRRYVKDIKDGPRKLPLKFDINRVNNS